MTEREKKWAFDILNCIQNIENFIGEIPFSVYMQDFKTQSAVERQLAIIGEVLSKLRNSESGIILGESEKIIGLRNRIIHAYDGIDQSIIYAIVKTHLPTLKSEVQKLM